MKFTLSFLKDFLDTNHDAITIGNALTSAGLEVESIEDKAKKYHGFVTAEILSAEKHPDADNLQICRVFDGKDTLNIVCGASNARKGIKVILAPIGTLIPNGNFMIKKSMIRGQESNGMLCSASELEFSDEVEGIIELPFTTKIGISLIKAMSLEEQLFEISITPNRSDCLGIYGIARDLAAKDMGKLKNLTINKVSEDLECQVKISITEDSGCERAVFRYIKNINNGLSPDWLLKKLNSTSAKTISFAVDVTNYMCFAYGRPMHAFDADKLVGGIIIRRATSGEKLTALNDTEITMEGKEIVIADSEGVIALAGIIGGKRTACDANTKNILLEIAVFDPISISTAGRKHNILSDARYRFERGIDSGFIHMADSLACSIIKNHCPEASFSNGVILGKKNIDFCRISYSARDFSLRSGFSLAQSEISKILSSLGFNITGTNGIQVTVPSWRPDVTSADDLTEEVLRIYGYDNVPMVKIPTSDKLESGKMVPPSKKRAKIATTHMASRGYNEVVTWSFMSDKTAKNFLPNDQQSLQQDLYIQNPISEELNYMRSSIVPNLLTAASYNVNHGTSNLSLFEVGPVFFAGIPGAQKDSCTSILLGNKCEKNIYGGKEKFDVFDIKTDLFTLINALGFDSNKLITEQNSAPSYYHPGQSASIKIGKNTIGVFGRIHPMILKTFNLDDNCFAFELFYEELPPVKNKQGKKPAYQPNNLASVKRDFAFLFPQDFAAGQLIKMVENIDKKHIEDVIIFDIYQGDKLASGQKSIAFSVSLAPKEKSFTDSEIDSISHEIIKVIERETGGKLRA